MFDYVERFYNPTRRHSALGFLSPMDVERQAQAAYRRVHGTGGSSLGWPKGLKTAATSGLRPMP